MKNNINVLGRAILIPSGVLLFLAFWNSSWTFTNKPEKFLDDYIQSASSSNSQNSEKNNEEQVNETTNEPSDNSKNKSTQKTGEKEAAPKNGKVSTSGNKSSSSISNSSPNSSGSSNAGNSGSAGTGNQPSSNQSAYASEVVRLCNVIRQQAGMNVLSNQNTKLQQAANIRAQEIIQNFSHTRPNGTTAYTVLSEVGVSYRAWGENIAYGQRTPQEVVDSWMSSPGHKANILSANFKEIAVGFKNNYWVQVFIG